MNPDNWCLAVSAYLNISELKTYLKLEIENMTVRYQKHPGFFHHD